MPQLSNSFLQEVISLQRTVAKSLPDGIWKPNLGQYSATEMVLSAGRTTKAVETQTVLN